MPVDASAIVVSSAFVAAVSEACCAIVPVCCAEFDSLFFAAEQPAAETDMTAAKRTTSNLFKINLSSCIVYNQMVIILIFYHKECYVVNR
jgi:hypothetical protein